MDIQQEYNDVVNRIQSTCQKNGRNSKDVKIVAVTKMCVADVLQKAYMRGLRVFGESRVQEFMQKKQELPSDIEWHFIGTLQKNKIKYILGQVKLIHSVDTLILAQEISRAALLLGIKQDVLLQVNIANEKSKYGFAHDILLREIAEIALLKGIEVKGLMTIAPYSDNPEEARPFFKGLRYLAQRIREMDMPAIEMKELSMGMSGDFQIAVEEGSTLVRIGSKIFGERSYFKGEGIQ